MTFEQHYLAIVKGESVEKQAQQQKRKAISSLKGQISVLEGKLPDLEDGVADAKEAEDKAIAYDGQNIDKNYPVFLANAHKAVEAAEELLANNKHSIEFFKEKLEILEPKAQA